MDPLGREHLLRARRAVQLAVTVGRAHRSLRSLLRPPLNGRIVIQKRLKT